MIGMIAATNLQGLIGYDGKLPFKNSTDLKRFKELTMNSTLIMGRKTWESLPKKELPGRVIHVVHRNWGDITVSKNIIHFNCFEQALKESQYENIWIVGGGEIYKYALLFKYPEIIDLTIHNNISTCSIKDNWKAQKEKSVFMPEIPYDYLVEKEYQNQEDLTLWHRIYKLRNKI